MCDELLKSGKLTTTTASKRKLDLAEAKTRAKKVSVSVTPAKLPKLPNLAENPKKAADWAAIAGSSGAGGTVQDWADANVAENAVEEEGEEEEVPAVVVPAQIPVVLLESIDAHVGREAAGGEESDTEMREDDWTNPDGQGEAAETLNGLGGRGGRRGRGDRGGRGGIGGSFRDLRDRREERIASSLRAVQGDPAGNISKSFYEHMVQWEAIDTNTNKHNTNVVIVDCVPKSNHGSSAVDVAKLLIRNLEMPPHTLKIAFFAPMGSIAKPGNFPRIKIILTGSDDAYEFRSRAFEKRGQKRSPWDATYVSNDVTKSTRVRAEILRRIGDKIKPTEGRGFEIYVSKFDIKPVLIFKDQVRKMVTKRTPYVECIERWGKLLKAKDLEVAKKISGKDLGKRFEVMFGVC